MLFPTVPYTHLNDQLSETSSVTIGRGGEKTRIKRISLTEKLPRKITSLKTSTPHLFFSYFFLKKQKCKLPG